MLNPSDLFACWITGTEMPKPAAAGEDVLQCLERHIRDFDGMSKRARLKYNYLRLIQIVCAALIPLVSTQGTPVWAGGLGVAVVIASSVEVAAQYYDKWVRWRRTWQQLIIERQAYLYKSDDLYVTETERDANLIRRVNLILQDEQTIWHRSSTDFPSKAPTTPRS